MLTIRQNLLETMKGGNPDRFVKQYEYLELIMESPLPDLPLRPGTDVTDKWGISWTWPEGQLGAMPVHDDEHIVLKDINAWKDYVHAPGVEYPEDVWVPAIAHAEAANRNEKFVSPWMPFGLFEMCHHLMGIEGALMGFYDAPDCMHELIAYLTQHKLNMADQIIEHLHPDAIFQHDDWGSQCSTFLSPDMFRTFFLEPWKKIYSYWKQHGVELVVHHSDSFAATLVPDMIEMGIDIWQGVMTDNNTPELIKQYGSQITFMGDIDSGPVDVVDWTPELVAEHVEKACRRCGIHHFIPNLTQGGNDSSFPGVYDAVNNAIDQMSKIMF
jgi:hypothetical protein